MELIGHNDAGGVVAVTETDMCGVDAIQFLTGCTYGKGNLIHLDYGKMAFSFYSRANQKAVRIVLIPETIKKIQSELDSYKSGKSRRKKQFKSIIRADIDTIFNKMAPNRPIPRPAKSLAKWRSSAAGDGRQAPGRRAKQSSCF